jgi:hypothetical protein
LVDERSANTRPSTMDSETEEIDSQTIPLDGASNSANAIPQKSSGPASTNSRPFQQQQQARRLQHRCIHILFLLLALDMIERSAGARVFIHYSATRAVHSHIPLSLRSIFTVGREGRLGPRLRPVRGIWESITWSDCSFYPPPDNHNKGHRTEEELSEVEILFRDCDEIDVFDAEDEEDIVEYLGDIHHHEPSRHDDEKSTKEAMTKVSKDELLKLPPSKWVSSPSAISPVCRQSLLCVRHDTFSGAYGREL